MKTKHNPMTVLTLSTLLLFVCSFVHALDDIVIFRDDETPDDGWDASSAGAAAGGKVDIVGDNRIPVDGENVSPGGNNSLKIVYELPVAPNASWFANVATAGWAKHNLTNYTYLAFFVKGDQQTGGRLTVRLEDDNAPTPNSTNAVSVEVDTSWREFRFPLDDFNWTLGAWHTNTAAPNRRQILQVAFTSQVGSGTVWIDDIKFVGPKASFTYVPPSGNGANAWADRIEGTVANITDINQHRIALYALGNVWFIQPFVGDLIAIQPNGTWSTGTHLGEKYAALLVKANFQPPGEIVRFPAVGGDILDITTITPILVSSKVGAAGDLVAVQMDPQGLNPDQDFGTQQGRSTVTFNGVDAGTVEQWNETQIQVRVPPSAASGPVLVTVDGVSWVGTIQKRVHPEPSQPDDTKFTVVEVDCEAVPNMLPADGNAQATVEATVQEKGTGIPVVGAPVTMRVTEGAGSISPVTDNQDGIYTATYTASTTAGTETITINLGSKTVTIRLDPPNGTLTVWPGDTNNDGTVDGRDVLPIGIHWLKNGPRRQDAAIAWVAQPAPVGWVPSEAVYADANGDGIIDQRDVLPIGANWGQKHNAAPAIVSIFAENINYQEYLMAYQAMLNTLEAHPIGKDTVELKIALAQLIRQAEPPPENSLLGQNFPNPFNPETWIPYQLAEDVEVTIHIYNVSGSLVRTIALGYKVAGRYLSKDVAGYWDGRSTNGSRVASGVYFYELEAGNFRATRKLIVAK